MSVKIRLARHGSKGRPFYWIVAANSTSPRDGSFLEKLGTYNPMLPRDSEDRVTIKAEPTQKWLSQGAQPTDRVAKLLERFGLTKARSTVNPNKAKPGTKRSERAEAKNAPAEEAVA